MMHSSFSLARTAVACRPAARRMHQRERMTGNLSSATLKADLTNHSFFLDCEHETRLKLKIDWSERATETSYSMRWQEGLAVASIVRDDPSTLPGDDPFPRARMHRDRNTRYIGIGIWNLN